MANIEDIKKLADEQGVELSEDMLETIAGGYYSVEEWLKMSAAEREKAKNDSLELRKQLAYCEYLDPDPVV